MPIDSSTVQSDWYVQSRWIAVSWKECVPTFAAFIVEQAYLTPCQWRNISLKYHISGTAFHRNLEFKILNNTQIQNTYAHFLLTKRKRVSLFLCLHVFTNFFSLQHFIHAQKSEWGNNKKPLCKLFSKSRCGDVTSVADSRTHIFTYIIYYFVADIFPSATLTFSLVFSPALFLFLSWRAFACECYQTTTTTSTSHPPFPPLSYITLIFTMVTGSGRQNSYLYHAWCIMCVCTHTRSSNVFKRISHLLKPLQTDN